MSSAGRALGVFRAGYQVVTRGVQRVKTVTGSGAHPVPQYRQYPQVSWKSKFDAEILSGFMWFWMLWNFWHDPEAVLGHFPWPDADAFTDEELGIPPDDME